MTDDPAIYADDDGEVLAVGEDQRRDMVERLAAERIDLLKAARRASYVHRALEILMVPGESIPWDGHAVSCEMGPRPARRVNEQELVVHSEELAPLGLAPREERRTVTVMPKVSDITAAKSDLALAGISVDQLLLSGGEPRPTVKIYEPKEER
jgi:hypothetical protein